LHKTIHFTDHSHVTGTFVWLAYRAASSCRVDIWYMFL